MPLLKPDSELTEIATKNTVTLIGNKMKEHGVPVNKIVEYIPESVGIYFTHVADAGKFITPIHLIKTKQFVFIKCMQYSNGSVLLSCIATGAVSALVFIPGPQQPAAIVWLLSP